MKTQSPMSRGNPLQSVASTRLARGMAVLALVAVAGSLGACRNSRRGVRVGNDAATLKVTVSNLAATDTQRTDWIYELSGCLPPLTGNLTGPSSLEFTAVGLKKGLPGCELRIRTLEAPAGVAFAGEDRVLYWSNNMTLGQDANGALSAVVDMQKLYAVASTATKLFNLTVPVQFAKAETRKPVTGQLKCTPELLDTPVLVATGATSGDFKFRAEISAEATFSCTELKVYAGGELTHQAELGTDGGFTARPGEDVTTKVIAVKAAAKPTEATVDVTTKAEACNQEGKVFNTETKACEDAP